MPVADENNKPVEVSAETKIEEGAITDQSFTIPVGTIQPEETAVAEPVLKKSDDDTEVIIAEDTVSEAAAPAAVKEEGTAKETEEETAIIEEPTAEQEFEIFSEIKPKEKFIDSGLALPLLEKTITDTDAVLANLPNLNYVGNPQGKHWYDTIRFAVGSHPANDTLQRSVRRRGSKWRQTIRGEKGMLHQIAPKFAEDPSQKLTGEKGVLRMRALIGRGGLVQVPLWHSGFWITLKTPGDDELLELNRRLEEEKITLGRQTYGFLFSNPSAFTTGWLMNFILDHVYKTSLQSNATEDLRTMISSLDISLLAWGMASAIYPQGFPYVRSVMNDAGGQTKTIREKLNVSKLIWTDTTTLTPWQVSHMSQRDGSNMSKEMVARYRDEFTIGKGRQVELSENITFDLHVPSVDEYITSGHMWINGIVKMVDTAFGISPDANERNKYIETQGKASIMRQYGHWVKSITIKGHVIEEVALINETLNALSGDDEVRRTFFKKVTEFLEDSTMSLIAIPATEPGDKSNNGRFPHLLALDVVNVFFTLLGQKTSSIQNRKEDDA
jgi:hypothetical protein